jgi:hypothetical protein
MITSALFDEILVRPVQEGADKLLVISGYATSAMAFNHIQTICGRELDIRVELIVGMCSIDGISESNHKGFQELMLNHYPNRFSCGYLTEPPPVHSKVYTWLRNDQPVACFTGSANYTQTAFGKRQGEAMTASDPVKGLEYFNSLIPHSLYCTHADTDNLVQIYNASYHARLQRERKVLEDATTDVDQLPGYTGLQSVRISLLDRYGNLPDRSGLNWGQRPEYHREPNQAYIKVPAEIGRSRFFPVGGIQFTILTDDQKVLVCTRAQQNDKAIECPHNNSLVGEYFRNRLGVPNGALVTLDHLHKYGRADVEFYKIDDETYYMNYAKP